MQMYSAMCASCVPGHFLGTSLHYVYYVVCISAYGVVFVFSIWFVDDWVRLLPLCAALVILVWALLHCFYPSAMLKKGLLSCPSMEPGTSPKKGALGDLLFGRGQMANIFEITFFKCKKSYVRSAVCTKCWAESVIYIYIVFKIYIIYIYILFLLSVAVYAIKPESWLASFKRKCITTY